LNTDELSLSECACTSEMQVKFTEVQKCLEDIGFSKKVFLFLRIFSHICFYYIRIKFSVEAECVYFFTFHGTISLHPLRLW